MTEYEALEQYAKEWWRNALWSVTGLLLLLALGLYLGGVL